MKRTFKIFSIVLLGVMLFCGKKAFAIMELNFSKMAAMIPQIIQSELYNIQEKYTTAIKDGTILQMVGQGFPEGGAMFANMAQGGFSFKNMAGSAFDGAKGLAGNAINGAVGDLKNKGQEIAGSALNDAKSIANSALDDAKTMAGEKLSGVATDLKNQGQKLLGGNSDKKKLDIEKAVEKAKSECEMPNWNDSELQVTAADVLNLQQQKENCYLEIEQTRQKIDDLKKSIQETIVKRDQLISEAILQMSTASEMVALNEFDREDLEIAIRELELEREKNMQLPEETEETLNFDEEIAEMEEQCKCVGQLAEEAAKISGVDEQKEDAAASVTGEDEEDISAIYEETIEKFFLKEDEPRNAENTSRINKNRQQEYYLSLQNLFATAVQTDGAIRQTAEKAQMMSEANTDMAQSNSGAQNMQIGVSIQVAKNAARLTRMVLARMRMEATENIRRWNTHYHLPDYSQDMTVYNLDFYEGEVCKDKQSGGKAYCRSNKKKSGFGFDDITDLYDEAQGAVSAVANAPTALQGAVNSVQGMATGAVAGISGAVNNVKDAAGAVAASAAEQVKGEAIDAAKSAAQSAGEKVKDKFKKKNTAGNAEDGGAQ